MDAENTNRSTLSKVMKFFLITGIGLPFVLLSWLRVAMLIGTFAYRRIKDIDAPQIIRELRWKLRNIDMSFDQLTKELTNASEQDSANFEIFRNDLIQELKDRDLSIG